VSVRPSVRPSVPSNKVHVRPIRVNVLLTLDRVNLDLLCPRWLPHCCYITATLDGRGCWGRIRLAEGRIHWLRDAYAGGGVHTLVEGRICLSEGCIRLVEGRIHLSEGRICLRKGCIWKTVGHIRLSKGHIRLAKGPLGRLRPPLCRTRLLHMLEMLAWKSTSPSNMPCQPIVLTRGKM
jgi:hypothetical protein